MKLEACYICSIALYGADMWTPRKADQKQVGSFETWFWRGKKKLSLTDRVTNEEASQRVREDRNVLHTIKRRKANWIGHIL